MTTDRKWNVECIPEELQLGDLAVEYCWGSQRTWTKAFPNWKISVLGPNPGECWYVDDEGTPKRLDDGGGFVTRWRVLRDKERPRPHRADWPDVCPRCAEVDAAVTLFTTIECRNGCYDRR